MVVIKPFAAIRPAQDKASQVAALPYDVMNSDEAREMVRGNPYSFLHVDKAEIDLAPSVDLYDAAVYAKAKENLDNMRQTGVYIQDETPHYYIYRLTMDGRQQTGLVATASIDDYLTGTIKKHERTREDKEQDRIRHVDTCNAQTGPIFLAYRSQAEITAIIDAETKQHPLYDFAAEDGVGHTVWRIENTAVLQALTALFAEVPSLYIADGHHRTASAAQVGLQRRQQNTANPKPEAPYNYFLSVLFPAEELFILDYNRVIKDLAGRTPEEFLQEVEKAGYKVTPQGKPAYKPQKPREFGMYLGDTWYKLDGSSVSVEANPVDRLDVSILQNTVLAPLLQIGDPRTDNRIDFIGGIRGLSELETRVDSGQWAVAFSMYPTAMEEVMAIADADMLMPPKSTWFEPKLRSGLFVHPLE